MRFIVISKQVQGLTAEQTATLYTRMAQFYENIPSDVILEADYIRLDKLGSYSILDVPNREVMNTIMAPFNELVSAEIIELEPRLTQSATKMR
jgi:5-bromo-4-chloroindolyl phosphate hydrolysis protein